MNHYTRQFHDQFEEVVSNVVKNTDGDLSKLKQLVAIREFVMKEVFQHPNLRIEQLGNAEESRQLTGNRRGYL